MMYRLLGTVVTVVYAVLANSEPLPQTITVGYMSTTGSTVPQSGTTLDVSAMLTNATGNEAVAFLADELFFMGVLSIKCPSAAAAYTIPLEVTIINGKTQAGMSSASHIEISGVLGGGSRVSIQGGYYSFVNSAHFIAITGAWKVTGGSTVEIVGASIIMTPGLTQSFALISKSSSSVIAITDGSSLSIANTEINMRDFDGGNYDLFLLNIEESSITVSSATLSIFNTTVGVRNSFFDSFQVTALYSSDLYDVEIISNGSLSIVSTSILVYSVSVGGSFGFCAIRKISRTVTISLNSTLAISSTTLRLSNLNAKSLNLYLLNSYMSVSGGSSLIFSNTTIGIHNTAVGGGAQIFLLSTASLRISEGSNATFSSTNIGLHNSSVAGTLLVSIISGGVTTSSYSTLFVFNTDIAVFNTSTVESSLLSIMKVPLSVSIVAGSTISIVGISVLGISSTATFLVLSISSILSVEGVVKLENIHVDGVFAKWMKSPSLTGSGEVHAVGIHTWGPGDMVSVSQTNNAPNFHLCRNYVNGTRCELSGSGKYACSMNISPLIDDEACTRTPSLYLPMQMSHSTTLSSSPKTRTPTPTPHTTVTLTATPSQSSSKVHSTTAFITVTYAATTPTPSTLATASAIKTHSFTSVCTVTISQTIKELPTLSSGADSQSLSLARTASSETVTLTRQLRTRSFFLSDSLFTASASQSSPHTLTHSFTWYPPCNFSCADVIAANYLLPNEDPQTAVGEYWSSFNLVESPVTMGCAPVSIPYVATYKGLRAKVLVHIRGTFDPQTPMLGIHLLPSLSSIKATFAVNTFSVANGTVFVVDVKRDEAEPARAETISLTIPWRGLLCGIPAESDEDHLPSFNIELGASPSPLNTKEKAVIAAVSILSSDMQTIAAVGLLRCTPGSVGDAESEATIRALVPVALSNTCTGAIQGALLLIGVSGFIATCTVGIWRRFRGLPWEQAAAAVRCPGIVLSVWGSMQMGLVVCGGRLFILNGADSDGVLGIVGLVTGAILPLTSVCLTYMFVTRRCYRLVQTHKASDSCSTLKQWMRSFLLPLYELDRSAFPTSAAFSTIVGKYRRSSCMWAGLGQTQPLVMLLVIFSSADACIPTLIVAGVVTAVVGVVCYATLQPNRVRFTNYVQSTAMGLSACVLFVAAKLVNQPLDVVALDANRALSMMQTGLSVVRLFHIAGTWGYLRSVGKDVFERGNPDGSLVVGEFVLPIAAFEARAMCDQGRAVPDLSRSFMASVSPQPIILPPTAPHSIRNPNAPPSGPDLNSSSASDGEFNVEEEEEEEDALLVTPTPQPGNRKVDGRTIIASLLDSHRGHNPMILPYERLYDSSDSGEEEEMALTVHH